MLTIWKFPLEKSLCRVELREGFKILSAQDQFGVPTIWVLLDHEKPVVIKTFHIYGTGHLIPNEPGDYIGTLQQQPFVWHVFMDKE